MQIIIVQKEIEEAIRNHVTSQVQVREGMRIDIDLSATRGPEGFKATINIVPENSPPAHSDNKGPAEPVESKPASVAARPAAAAPATTTAAGGKVTRAPRIAKADTAAAASPEPAKPATEAAPDQEAPVEEPTDQEQDGQGAELTSEEAPATPPAAGKSLFGGLTRPQN